MLRRTWFPSRKRSSPGLERPPAPPGLAGQQLRRGWVTPSLSGRTTLRGERRILVLHVPKTAGSSLRLMLAAHVPKERTFLSTGKHEWTGKSMTELRPYTLFVGHNFLEPLYLFPDDTWVTVLPVRDPLSWWQSFYKYARRRAEAAGTSEHPTVRLSMEEWLDSMSDQDLSNAQTSWLLARMRVMFDSPLSASSRISDTGMSLRDRPEAALELLDRLVDRVTVVGSQRTSTASISTFAKSWSGRLFMRRRRTTTSPGSRRRS
jgi:hypothetical protein